VQANVPILTAEEWTPEYFQRTMSELDITSLPAVKDAERVQGLPGLIVWPESPAPFFVSDPAFRASVTRLAQEASAYIVAGSLGVKQEQRPGIPQQLFNSAALITPSGDWAARYDKLHLVPFGEYVPFKSMFVFAEKLTREVGDFNRGASREPLVAGGSKLGVFICYESIFPDEVRQFAHDGAQVFINISNDGWFGPTGAPGQHLNMARMRAIENRRWLLRATNTGITSVIDPFGRVVATAPRNQLVALNAPYALINDTTFYTRYGDWFAYACAIITIIGLLLPSRSRLPGRLIWSKN
jgi:apolipoprotein N-acyltransferase